MQSSCTSKMVFYFPLPFDARGSFFGGSGRPRGFSRGNFVYPLYVFLKFYLFPSTRSGRAGPLLFCSCRKVSKRQAQGSFTPLRIPGPKWGAGRPPLETPKSRCATRIGRTPRRLRGWSFGAVGEGRKRMRARHSRRTSSASGWGLTPPGPLRSPLGNICRSCANAHGTAFETAFAAMPSQISRKLQPRSGEEFRHSPRANCGRRPRQCAKENFKIWGSGGNPKGGAALFGQSLPTFCWPESRGPARPAKCPEGVSASKGKIKNLKKGKGIKKALGKKAVPTACEVPRRGKRVEGINQNFQ